MLICFVPQTIDGVESILLQEAIQRGAASVDQLREDNLVGRILWLQKNRATEFFSRWIELKESIAQ